MSDAVDVDLLADYVGGALDGTPEADQVAALVATSPEWAREHELLVAALAATADDLAEYAAAAGEPMPAAVTERLLAALAAEGPLDASAPSPAGGQEAAPGRRPADGGGRVDQRAPADGRPGGVDGGHAGPARNLSRRRRRRWAAWAAPVLVAAAVAGFAGVWINQAAETANTASDSAGSSAVAPESGGVPPASVLGAPAVPQATSGRDYTGALVAGGFRGSRASASAPGSTTMSQNREGTSAGSVDPALRRLTAPAALSICVEAIAQAHGQGPITVQAADFASYEGQPAVVVFFTDAAGARWGWASGSDCGPAGADTLFSTPVR